MINDTTVRNLLSTLLSPSSGMDSTWDVDQVCGQDLPGTGRRKIFAILALTGEVGFLQDFILGKIYDFHLPLKSSSRTFKRRNSQESGLWEIGDLAGLFQEHSHLSMKSFERFQSLLLAPFFNIYPDHVYFYKLSDSHVLPFIEYEAQGLSESFRLAKVKIHRAHHSSRWSEVNAFLTVVILFASNCWSTEHPRRESILRAQGSPVRHKR